MFTEEQLEAVQSEHQETVVVAGAGAGKTKTLVGRVKHMIEKGIDPSTIIVITFSKKAAAEVAERLGDDRVKVGTFHSICLDLITERRKAFFLTDEMADEIVAKNNKTLKKPVTRKTIDAYRTALALGKPGVTGDIKKAAELYIGRLKHEKAVDYLGMLIEGLEIARTLGSHHVLVDESQDTDDLQWLIVDALKKDGTGFYVGDARQQLYGWRGVREEALDERHGHRVCLTKTFRFGADLCEFSDKVAEASGYKGPGMTPGSDRTTTVGYSELDYYALVSNAIGAYIDPSSIAVLCRYNEQREAIIQRLEENHIPVAKEKAIDHSTAHALFSFLADPSSSIAHGAFLANKKAAKLLPSLASETLSTASVAAMAEVWLSEVADNPTVSQICDKLSLTEPLAESFGFWKSEYGDKTPGQALKEFATRDQEEDVERIPGVRVMTIHGSKGLEFDHVFVVLPPVRRFSAAEWRCAYVACTRAKKEMILTGTENPVIDLAYQLQGI